MNFDKIVAIDDNIVTISTLFSRSDNLTSISLNFYKIDTPESGLTMSGLPATCNIAQRRAVVVYYFAEVVENKTGLCRYLLLCGPDSFNSSSVESLSLRLYTVDSRQITLFSEIRLPANVQTCQDLKFEILDGPTVCFVVLSDVYVATSDGAVRIYPTGVEGIFGHLTSWVQDDYLFVTGLSAGQTKHKTDATASSQSTMLTLCVNTSRQLFTRSCDVLLPDVYYGMIQSLFTQSSNQPDQIPLCYNFL